MSSHIVDRVGPISSSSTSSSSSSGRTSRHSSSNAGAGCKECSGN